AFSQAPPAGTAGEGSFSPNMFGDQFGAGRLRLTLQPPPLVIPAVPAVPGAQLRLGGLFLGGGKGGTTGALPFTAPSTNSFRSVVTSQPTTIFSTPVNPPLVFVSQNTALLGTATVPLAINTVDQQATLQEAIRRLGPGGTLNYVPSASFAQLLSGNNIY